MIPGTTVQIGNTKYLIPPLNMKAMKKHKPYLIRMMQGGVDPTTIGEEDFDVMCDIVFLAIKRNYPELTAERLDEDLDMANIQQAMVALMKVSGFEDKETEPGK